MTAPSMAHMELHTARIFKSCTLKKEAAHILDVDYGALRTMLHSIVEKKAKDDNEAVRPAV